MDLSVGVVVGLCAAFSMSAAQMYVLVSAEGTALLLPDRGAVLKMVGWSLVFTVPVSVTIWTANWLADLISNRLDDPLKHARLSIAALLLVAWALAAMVTVATSGAKRVKLATGIDVLMRERNRTALIGGALTMILGGIYIFGGHLIRTHRVP